MPTARRILVLGAPEGRPPERTAGERAKRRLLATHFAPCRTWHVGGARLTLHARPGHCPRPSPPVQSAIMRRTFLALVTAGALTGCSFLAEDRPCTLMDMDSQVSAVWRPGDFGGRDAVTVRLCVEDACEERVSGGPDEHLAGVSVRLPDDAGPGTVPVELTVTSGKDGEVVADRTRARLREEHPNGRSCPPTVWTAAFRAHPVDGLTSTKGLAVRPAAERRATGEAAGSAEH